MTETILIVDDQMNNIQLVASLLVPKEYELLTATSAQDAFKILENRKIDLLLLDFEMPEMDGFEACLRLREIGYTFPIILLIKPNESSQIIQTFEGGANDYVFKPVNTLELLARVENQLTLKRTQDKLSKKLSLEVEKELRKKREVEYLLVENSKMAQIGEMFSMITHQWKQPLNAITLACTNAEVKMQLGTYKEEDSLSVIKDISSYVVHLATTINDFKSFFKPIRDFSCIKASDLVGRALLFTKERLTYNNINVDFDAKETLEVTTIENEMIQVLLILLQNSLDAFEESKTKDPKIKVEIKDNKNWVSICISDNAGGIEHVSLSQIFDANFSTKDSKGSGIGLYMCALIIEQHCKGYITACNNDDGASFCISLPKRIS